MDRQEAYLNENFLLSKITSRFHHSAKLDFTIINGSIVSRELNVAGSANMTSHVHLLGSYMCMQSRELNATNGGSQTLPNF